MISITDTISPTKQMEPIKLDNLLINFTTEFHRVWNTAGSRAKPATFWRPAPSADELPGYFPLGDIVVANSTSTNGQMVTAVVCEGEPGIDNPRGKALSRPTDYELVWKDTGSGAAARVSIWRPIPPTGYVALGMTCSNDYNKPSFNAVRCVRADLVVAASLGDLIWDDKSSGATLSFSAWHIVPQTAAAGEIYFAPGTFAGAPTHTKPTTSSEFYALQMQIPLQINSLPKAPSLSEHTRPVENGEAKVTHIARLPWFAIREYAHPNEGFQNSQYYELKRTDQYVLVGYGRNSTETALPIKWKAPRAQNVRFMKLFNRHTAIEITKAWPDALLSDIRATKFSACLHKNFTHTETSASEWSESSPQVVIAMAGKLKSVAVYQMESHYELVREDGTEVTVPLGYTDDTSFVMSEYPPEPVETATLMPVMAGNPSTETITGGVSAVQQSSSESSTVTDSAP